MRRAQDVEAALTVRLSPNLGNEFHLGIATLLNPSLQMVISRNREDRAKIASLEKRASARSCSWYGRSDCSWG